LSPDANELTLSKNENDKTSTNEQEILQPQLNVTALRQIARDVLLICIDTKVYITNLSGRLKYWNVSVPNANVELSTNETTESTTANDNDEQVPGGNVVAPQEQSQSTASQLEFPFRIDAIVCLSDSVLALHRHGVQGRSLVDGSVTQDLHDTAHVYRMLGSDKAVVFECRNVQGVLQNNGVGMGGTDLCILTGHESTLNE